MCQKNKEWKAPHVFVILIMLIFLAVAATHFVPAGEFNRYVNTDTGKNLVIEGSYHLIETKPVSFFLIPGIIYRAIVKSAGIITFILLIGGSFAIITSTNALTALCKKLSAALSGREFFVIPIFLCLFSVFGFTMGMSSEVMIFVPTGIALAISLGLDKVTGTAMITIGAATGFTAGILNPFNVGVAQDIAQIPLFSGIGYRIVLLITLLIIDTFYIICYARKVKLDPQKSITYGEEEVDFKFDENNADLTKRQLVVLGVVIVGFCILIYGLVSLNWNFEEMSALFITMGVVCGLICGYNPSKIASIFGQGAKDICIGALIVGIARSVELVLSEASILDTIIVNIINVIGSMPVSVQAVGMFLIQSLINCVITSGSGQAAITMPLMIPISDLVGISRQTAVLAFQMGDGFSNSILPTSSALMGYLAVSKIPYVKWMKFMVPLFLIWTAIGCLFMAGAVAIGY
ncbi:YfcC family protein [Lacrimispora sp.]|uniref:YfcC family protein n=1 Tax=Lacrimispora sp. TaxID=2719234 RepID=UPI00289EF7E8|nr:AbgT family transporter [Lacrimispora sp.]